MPGRPAANPIHPGAVPGPRRRLDRPLLLAAVASLLLHAFVLGPAFVRAITAEPDRMAATGALVQRLQPPVAPPIEPGVDADTPVSLNWIGYEEYREHLAELFETEQAALAPDASAAAPGVEGVPGAVIAPPPPATPESAPETVAAAPPVPEAVAPSDAEALAAEVLAALRAGAVTPGAETPTEPDAAPTTDPPAPVAPEPTEPVEPAPAETPPTPTPTPTPDAPTEPVEPTDPADTPGDGGGAESPPSDAPGDGEPAPAEPDDRESPATSTVDVPREEWKRGKPISRPGVEVIPVPLRRSDLDAIERLVAPSNPVAVLSFVRYAPGWAKPRTVTLERGTGIASVDPKLEAVLHEWRARGARVDDLAEGESFEIVFRIVLNPRAPR